MSDDQLTPRIDLQSPNSNILSGQEDVEKPVEEIDVADNNVDIQVDMSHISSSSANIAGHNIIHIKVDSSAQAQEILESLKQDSSARRPLPPPPVDAPLQEKVNHWFTNDLTTDRQKFFAISLTMFNGLKYPDFKDIYEMVLQVLEVDEVEKDNRLHSRFENSDDVLIDKIEAKIVPSEDGLEEVLEFKDESYVSAIYSLLRNRHRDILLDLLPALKEVVERYRYWEVRHQAAVAVAEIGKLGFHRIQSQVLQLWASDSRSYVRAAVGYPLAWLSEGETTRSAVKTLLGDWTDPDWNGPGETWRYRWAAASTYKQIGLIEAGWARDWAYQGLKDVAGFDDIRLADAVIHSLVVLSLQGQLERTLLTIRDWIEQGSAGNKVKKEPQIRCVVAILSFMVLSEIHIEIATEDKEEAEKAGIQTGVLFDLVRQSEEKKDTYWQLMTAIGVRTFEFKLANAFFNLIARWTQHAADNAPLQNTVRNLLVDVYIEVRPHQREIILKRLNRWQRQKKDQLRADMATSAKAKIKDKILNESFPPPNKIVFG